MRDTEAIFRNSIEEELKNIIRKDKNGMHILIENLKKLTPVDIYAFELLSPYGFNETVIRDILHSPYDSSGKIFYSSTYRLIKNLEELILNPRPNKKETLLKNAEISIPENKKEIRKPIHLSFTKTATIKIGRASCRERV